MDQTLAQILNQLVAVVQERDRLLLENQGLRSKLPVEEVSPADLAAAVDELRQKSP